MKNIPLNERIVFALDVPDPEEAKKWVEQLDANVRFYKVGLQLFLAGRWDVVDHIVSRGNKVMLDLKFFDIPETVHLAVQQLKNRGVTFATVHGNDAILEGATQDKGELKILAVTVLTSFDESDMQAMGYTKTVKDLVTIRAEKALRLGCDGLVASPHEAAALRQDFGNNYFIVAPGIRPGINRDIYNDDQKRVATAKQAIADGADHVVIGRPISKADNPLKAVQGIQREIEEALTI